MVAGRYRLLELIGSGGMGIVWLAFDTVEPRQVALKRPHAGGPGTREQLLREAEVAARVAHPNAIKVFDVIVDGDACWLVMEYFNAASLADLLNRGTALPPLRVAGIGTQIAAALTAAHAVEVVHRDVTPANILVAEGGTAKVTDYGISAWRAATVTSSGKISGTAAYVSPEVANGSGAKAPSDVYSLGATLFAAVEGEPPCGTGDPEVVLARLRAGTISPVRRAGPLEPVLAALLQSDPRCRPTAEQATDMLGTIAQGRAVPRWVPPVVTEPRTTPLSRGSFLRRRATLVSLAAAVVVIALVAIVFQPWRGDPSTGAGSGSPKPNTDIAPVLGDPRSADPCALVDAKELTRFGDTEVDKEYGGFNRCDVLVDLHGDGSDEQIDVELQFLGGVAEEPKHPKLTMTDPTMKDGDCGSMLILTDGNRVDIVAKGDDELTADLCAMVTAAANAATARMSDGELPRRAAPLPTESLAQVDACTLGDAPALPELAGAAPEPGYANWSCEWNGEDAGVEVILEHSSPLTAEQDGEARDIAGRQALVVEDGDGRCMTSLVYREYLNDRGDPRVDVAQVAAMGDFPNERLCEMSVQLAGTVAATLPT